MAGFENPHFGEREAWSTQIAQNSARTAWAWGTAKSSGWGEFVIEDPIMFGVTFVYEPNVAHGFALGDDNQLVEGRFPRAGGGVMAWIQDSDDHYIGAHVIVTVSTADPILAAQAALVDAAAVYGGGGYVGTAFEDFRQDPGYDITHSFTFVGLSFKTVT